MTAAITEALTCYLDVDVAADKWDEQPSLALIARDAEGVVCFHPVPVPEFAWSVAEPHRVVVVAGQTALTLRRAGWSSLDDGETLLGLVLFSEGWGLSGKPEDEEAMREYTSNNRIADHPQRVEFKLVNAVLTDGSMVMLTHARGGKTESLPTGRAEGRIPDALTEALTAFQEAVSDVGPIE